jgi:hypothetical protein
VAGCSTSAATVIGASGIAAPTAEEKPVACNVKKLIVVMSRVWVPKGVGIIAFASASTAGD